MSEDVSCRVCEWTGEQTELSQPPGVDDKHYCPECATIIEIE
jgi:hypothetical protein